MSIDGRAGQAERFLQDTMQIDRTTLVIASAMQIQQVGHDLPNPLDPLADPLPSLALGKIARQMSIDERHVNQDRL